MVSTEEMQQLLYTVSTVKDTSIHKYRKVSSAHKTLLREIMFSTINIAVI